MGYREVNGMLCDRFYTVGGLYIQYDIYDVLLRPAIQLIHRFFATFRDERRWISCRVPLGFLLEQLPDDRNSFFVASVVSLGQIHERMSSRPIDAKVMFEFIVPILHLSTPRAMHRKRCLSIDGSSNDVSQPRGGKFRSTHFPCSARIRNPCCGIDIR